MDDASKTRDVDVSLNLGLAVSTPCYQDAVPEGPCRVASSVRRGGSVNEEVDLEKKMLEALLLFIFRGNCVSPVDRSDDQRNEVSSQEYQDTAFRKRKLEYSSDEEYCKRPRESNRSRVRKVYYEVDASDMSLVVNDGYQWRKYGQKVTRGNPSPRAYFKCSHAPSCPVKKKVQRSVDNPNILIANYEGEHNHRCPPSHAATTSLQRNSFGSSHSVPSSSSSAKSSSAATISALHPTRAEVPQNLSMQQVAASLTRNPAFTAAITRTMLNHMLSQIDGE